MIQTEKAALAIERDQQNLKFYLTLVRAEVRLHLQNFFADKSYHFGGPIDQRHLTNESHVNLILSTPFCDGVDQCYAVMPRPNDPNFDEVKALLELLNDVKGRHIPKEFQAGVMLLYYKLCKGMKIPEKKELDLTHIIGWTGTCTSSRETSSKRKSRKTNCI
jgi:hypothetical protein